MRTIGLIPLAAKPYHSGHDGLVRIAADECDEVHLFVSTSDRSRKGELPIYGADMKRVWDDYIEPSLPSNVTVEYGGIPVQQVYEEIQASEATEDFETTYVIYSDATDILKYTDSSLSKAAPKMFANGLIERRGVDRSETVNISGTKMREFMAAGDVRNFKKFLPEEIRQYAGEILSILTKGKSR